jgi:hypothetical protein
MLIEDLGCFSCPEYDGVKIEFRTSTPDACADVGEAVAAGIPRLYAPSLQIPPSVQPPTPVGTPIVAAPAPPHSTERLSLSADHSPSTLNAGPFLGRACEDCKEGRDVGDDICKWMCFISHHQEATTGFAKTLQVLMESELERRQVRPSKVWLDMTEDASEQGMHDGVRFSNYFVMFMSAKMLAPRPNGGKNWCIQEVQWALQHRKPIIIVFQINPNWGGVAGNFSHFYKKEIERAFPAKLDRDWILKHTYSEYHHRGEFDQAMLRRILRNMPEASESRPQSLRESSRESRAAPSQGHHSCSGPSSARGVAYGQVRDPVYHTLRAWHQLFHARTRALSPKIWLVTLFAIRFIRRSPSTLSLPPLKSNGTVRCSQEGALRSCPIWS